ncbi:c-type cytochrome [Methylobacterium sp. J-068]|uniref:c-type cytochrome n=1 Tax=Methylobacterium sp. J-068 TaxID=2836649 RepID=UPI001FBB7C94|nr:cytochrome c family protein [Methylobacterium sp. J-068]MCJ2036550.1 c-type cytochrome [Methylobacterium sp. J-068]
MDSFELNKVAGAALGALLFAVGSGFVAELIYHPKPAGPAGYALPEPQAKAGGGAAPEAKAEPLPIRLASASADKGQAAAKKCASCHSFEKGGPNKVGPHLWGVVDRQRAHEPGFEYSAALKEKGGTWTYDELDHFLTNPKGYVPGTKMAFAGISSPTERADVITYLRTLADTPAPLPAVEKKAEAEKPADTKPAAADAKPADKPAEAKAAPDSKPAAEVRREETAKDAGQKGSDKAKPSEDQKPEVNVPGTAAKPTVAGEDANKPASVKPADDTPVQASPAAPSEPATTVPAEKPAQP